MERDEANAMECLVNLLYLIRLRAADPADVLTFVDMAEPFVQKLVAAAQGNIGIQLSRKPETPHT